MERTGNGLPSRPGLIGRAVRVVLGFLLLRLFWSFATGYEAVVQPGNIVLFVWAALGAFTHVLGTLAPPLSSARTRLPLVGAALCAALFGGRLQYGAWWSPPLRWTLFLLALAAMGILGAEFVAAAITAQPGCEKDVIPNLLRRGGPPRVHPCPLWDPIDRWERRLRSRRHRPTRPERGRR